MIFLFVDGSFPNLYIDEVQNCPGELMFDGYEDPVLQIYSSFEFDEEDEQDSFFDDDQTTPGPPKIPMDKFGWFYKVGDLEFSNLGEAPFKKYVFKKGTALPHHQHQPNPRKGIVHNFI